MQSRNKASSQQARSTTRIPKCSRLHNCSRRSEAQLKGNWRRCQASSGRQAVPLCSDDSYRMEAPVQPRDAAAVIADSESSLQEYDVLGLGQLMIDYAAAVDDQVLHALDVPKGGRRVISVAERAAVMEKSQGFNSQVSAGGSLANSLVGISQLATAREEFLAKATATHQPTSSNGGTPHSASPVSSGSSSSSGSSPQHRLRVAMAGCCGGSDALGEFGRAQMTAAGVDIIPVGDESTPWAGSATGTVMVFTTPDAQRSFLSSFSSEDRLHLTDSLLAAVSRARLLVVEGYLWELPGAAEVIPVVVEHAHAVGTLVVLTAGDASVVQRHGDKVLDTIHAGVDMFVSNVAEAQELVQFLRHRQQQQQQQHRTDQVSQPPLQQHHQELLQDMGCHAIHLDPQGSASLDSLWDSDSSSSGVDGSSSEGQVAACELAGVCPLVVVTDGSRGSYITALGQLLVVPPFWRSHAPVDTCGAGDAYCSGFLFAFLLGLDLHTMGHVAAKTASAVISRRGPQLLPADAAWVAGPHIGRSSMSAGLTGSISTSASSSSSSMAAVHLQPLGLGVDASVEASHVVQGASQ